MLSDNLKIKKKRYVDAYNQANATANALKVAINNLNNLISNQKQVYSVDGITGFESKLNDILEKLNKDYDKIVNTVLPGTKTIIDNLNESITAAIAEEVASEVL